MAPERQRLFFALWPDAALQARCGGLAAEVLGGAGRRIPAEKLHLTLSFLGSVDAPARACLEGGAETVRAAPFTLTLDRLGHFPRPQVLWLGTEAPPPELLHLVEQLRQVQRGCALEPERRRFQAHLTLARKVRRRPRLGEVERVTWPVTDFALVASQTLPSGARYEVVARWPLNGAHSSAAAAPGPATPGVE